MKIKRNKQKEIRNMKIIHKNGDNFLEQMQLKDEKVANDKYKKLKIN